MQIVPAKQPSSAAVVKEQSRYQPLSKRFQTDKVARRRRIQSQCRFNRSANARPADHSSLTHLAIHNYTTVQRASALCCGQTMQLLRTYNGQFRGLDTDMSITISVTLSAPINQPVNIALQSLNVIRSTLYSAYQLRIICEFQYPILYTLFQATQYVHYYTDRTAQQEQLPFRYWTTSFSRLQQCAYAVHFANKLASAAEHK